jgi:integrase
MFSWAERSKQTYEEASVNQVIKRIGYKSKVSGHGFRHMMLTYCMSMGLIPVG